MLLNEIIKLIKLGESEILELKKTTGERKEAAKTACAMLNTRGGHIIFGVSPEQKILGQNVSDRTLEEIAQELKNIDPPIFPSITRHMVKEHHELIIITITQGTNPPYSYKGESFKRVGNTNQLLSRHEYNKILFESLHTERRWENEIAMGWSIDDLDNDLILTTFNDASKIGRIPSIKNPTILDILRGFNLIKDKKIIRAAVALFGHQDKIREWTQMCLKVASFRGKDKNQFIDNRHFEGNAFYLFDMALKFFSETIPIASNISEKNLYREDIPLYPPIAFREAIANAICHRDYSIGGGSISVAKYNDRLEVTSTGGLHFGLTPEALYRPHESKPWNPLIARVFYYRGIIERWGRGTLKILEESQEAGLKTPLFDDTNQTLTVTFYPLESIDSSFSLPTFNAIERIADIQSIILNLLKSAGPKGLGISELETLIPSLNRRKIKYELTKLNKLGLIMLDGKSMKSRWKIL